MEIEDEFELMDDSEEEDFDHVLSDDSNYESDTDEDTLDKKLQGGKVQDFKQAEINTFDEQKKMCVVYFYFLERDYTHHKYCSKCVVSSRGEFEGACAVRRHRIRKVTDIRGKYCTQCTTPLYQIIPCNLCYICTN
jgi:hypothetical protein